MQPHWRVQTTHMYPVGHTVHHLLFNTHTLVLIFPPHFLMLNFPLSSRVHLQNPRTAHFALSDPSNSEPSLIPLPLFLICWKRPLRNRDEHRDRLYQLHLCLKSWTITRWSVRLNPTSIVRRVHLWTLDLLIVLSVSLFSFPVYPSHSNKICSLPSH